MKIVPTVTKLVTWVLAHPGHPLEQDVLDAVHLLNDMLEMIALGQQAYADLALEVCQCYEELTAQDKEIRRLERALSRERSTSTALALNVLEVKDREYMPVR